ncbi:hypothetical protein ACFOOJ_13800 [Sphingobium xenophagum]|uniref:hypothetical protein n=1 Tax=Sphingobium xenophagum TaxID=121428 RepID=UPI00157D18B3|nr:hypothetical protein [Sphingobium xenophagum]
MEKWIMPKQNECERLVDLEARQRRLQEEIAAARSALRTRYGAIVAEIPIEAIGERVFRDILQHAIRAGGTAPLQAVKALPLAPGELSPTTKSAVAYSGPKVTTARIVSPPPPSSEPASRKR